jgi:hypothetical protein
LTHFVYFIGGPEDLTKKAYPKNEPEVSFILFRQIDNIHSLDHGVATFRDHRYVLRRIGRDVWAGIYEPML